MLATSRIHMVGESPHAHEQEAIQFAIDNLPGTDPYTAWALVELLEPATGRLYEIDLLVLGYSALYLVEIKSGPGKYDGDQVDWYWTPPDRPARWMDPPIRLANLKAKVLKSRLRSKMHSPDRAPRVEALVFLSHPDLDLRLSAEGRVGVVTRKNLVRAITHHEFPGAPTGWRADRVDAPIQKDVTQALAALGLRKRKGKMFAGQYELGGLIDDGILQLEGGADGPPAPSGYQDRVATHREAKGLTQRARVYLVPQQTSVERRQVLHRAADREVQLLHTVREHKHVLAMKDYIADAPLGPTVLFDAFEGGIPLDAFMRQTPQPSFEERLAIVEQVSRALAHCHKLEVRHGALGPHAVLVRRSSAGSGSGAEGIETRLFNFQLGAGHLVRGTIHASALSSEPWALYQAPELRQETGAPTILSDIFSLGALAYFVFTGMAPAPTVADLDARLVRDGRLDPRAATDSIPKAIAEFIAGATERVIASRPDDVGEWLNLMAEALAPAPTALLSVTEIDPLEAKKEECLDGDLTLKRVLGYGATSKVLEVERASDGRLYALKVSLALEHDDRLREEATLLRRLDHSRIVQIVDGPRSIANRVCLLLTHAGDRTLQKELAQEGTVSLDFAGRFGDDLLSALVELEQKGVIHRDIKPANVGVGTVGNAAKRLLLFDFSLGLVSLTELSVGTAVYRDPCLRLRGVWDAAADRWSAAVTLHEMLTGVRPAITEGADAASITVALAAERFDAAVRDGLVTFFKRALAPDAEKRFATANEMRAAWARAASPADAGVVDGASPTPQAAPATPPPGEVDYAAIGPETLIEALPVLDARAKNALDRAGVLRARDLLDLRENRISAIRGVGSKVARSILDFRDAWRAALAMVPEESQPFFAGFAADDLMLATTDLAPAVAIALGDAGIHTTAVLASSPSSHVRAIADKHGFKADTLVTFLERRVQHAGTKERPTTIEGWLDALLPPPSTKNRHKRAGYVRMAYGLEEPFLGRIDVSAREVAAHVDVTTANFYLGLGALREGWAKHASSSSLRELVHAILDEASGAMPLERASEALRARLAHDRAAPPGLLAARGAALARVVAEIEKDAPTGVRIARINGQGAWLVASDAHTEIVAALGQAADELAQRSVLASGAEAARVFGEKVDKTVLGSAPPERIAEIAAQASRTAARSTRLEIYPRGLAASRALELSAAVLSGGLSVSEVQRRVAARYPDAEPLPDRPALDALLAPLGLVWVESGAQYTRKGESLSTTMGTSYDPPAPVSTVSSGHPKAMSLEALDARAFDEKVANAIERKLLRVMGVSADLGRDAALRLSARAGTAPVSFDAELIAAMTALIRENEVDPEVVHSADRDGPAGPAWANLLQLAEAAADVVAKKLLPPKKPLVLTQPGLLARYRLDRFIEALVEASKDRDAEAIFLVVPAHETGGIPRINGALAIKGVLPADALWVSRSWIENKHNAAA